MEFPLSRICLCKEGSSSLSPREYGRTTTSRAGTASVRFAEASRGAQARSCFYEKPGARWRKSSRLFSCRRELWRKCWCQKHSNLGSAQWSGVRARQLSPSHLPVLLRSQPDWNVKVKEIKWTTSHRKCNTVKSSLDAPNTWNFRAQGRA
jgi:hypothetical protein